jgi:DNA-binding response OmpR family regulator
MAPVHDSVDRILFVDDDVENAQGVKCALATHETFHVEQAFSLQETLRASQKDWIAAILLNPFLCSSEGTETVRAMLAAAPSIPLLLLVG